MNERIFKIALEAMDFHGAIDTDTELKLTNDQLEKFVELILTEVISTIYRSDISDKKQEKLVDELAYKFGMK